MAASIGVGEPCRPCHAFISAGPATVQEKKEKSAADDKAAKKVKSSSSKGEKARHGLGCVGTCGLGVGGKGLRMIGQLPDPGPAGRLAGGEAEQAPRPTSA